MAIARPQTKQKFVRRFVDVKDQELFIELETRGYMILYPGHECVDRPHFACRHAKETLFDASFALPSFYIKTKARTRCPFNTGFGLSGDLHTSQTWLAADTISNACIPGVAVVWRIGIKRRDETFD